MRPAPHRLWLPPVRLSFLLAAAVLAALLGAVGFLAAPAGHASPQLQENDFRLPCSQTNTFVITTCFVRGETFDEEPALVAFRDTPDDSEHIKLAAIADIGAAWGLAYHEPRNEVYIAAYHKRNTHFGPAGPGAIYAIELNSGAVRTFTVVPDAGPDEHDPSDDYQPDNAARPWVGKTSLGDLDLANGGSELLVTNLRDRRIYRYSVPDAQPLGSFETGGMSQSWAADARPFGLKVLNDGTVLHAVVASAQSTEDSDDLFGVVYASNSDGSNMREVLRVDFAYDRGELEDWNPWHPDDNFEWRSQDHPQPMITDLETDDRGNLILGIRDRFIDTGPSLTEVFRTAPGDILLAPSSGTNEWTFDPGADEFYIGDGLEGNLPELAEGGLAALAGDFVVTTAMNPFQELSEGAIWFNNRTGLDIGREELLFNSERHDGPQGKAQGLGDVERVCTSSEETPEPTVTASAVPNTPVATTPAATSTRAATSTPLIATQTPDVPALGQSPTPESSATARQPQTTPGDDDEERPTPAPGPTQATPELPTLPNTGAGGGVPWPGLALLLGLAAAAVLYRRQMAAD